MLLVFPSVRPAAAAAEEEEVAAAAAAIAEEEVRRQQRYRIRPAAPAPTATALSVRLAPPEVPFGGEWIFALIALVASVLPVYPPELLSVYS